MNRSPGLLRRTVAVAAAAIAAAASLTCSASTATAAVPQVTVEITGVEVTGSRPSDQVTVTGRVSNPTGSTVYGLRMAMWRSRDPIGDLAALRQVTGVAVPPGVILTGDQGGGYDTIYAQNVPFEAGATAEFTVHASLDDLGFDVVGKAYLVGARALGTSDGSIAFGRVGQGSTVIAVPGEPVPVTRLVMLTATPTKLTSGVFRNEDLVAELTGRLDALLTAAAEPGMSWLIDPALFDEVTDLANGYQVRDGDSLRPGTGQQVAKAWLQRFEQLDRTAGAGTLFGTPDLSGAAAAGDPEVLARAKTATDQVAGLRGLPLLAWPTGGVYTELVDAYLSGDTPLLATNPLGAGALQTSAGGRTVLASAVTLPAEADDFAARQLTLAETVLAGEAGQLRVLREPADLAADRATTTAWQEPRPLDALLAGAARPGSYQAVTPITLSPREFRKVADLERAVAAYRQLAPDSVIPDEAAGLLTRAVSQTWIGQDAAHAALLKEIDGLIGPAALKNAVTLDASPRFVMSARTSQFPLTVTNHLAESVRVKVQVDTDNPQRLRIPDSEVVTIAAGQSASITIRPEATANGVAIARAWVATVSGSQVSPFTEITVEMTELGFVGWVIVLASGSVVLGATALRIWQVRRKAGRDAAPSPDVERQPSGRAPRPGDKRSTVSVALAEPDAVDGTDDGGRDG
ncbi:MAG: hypothetical protein KIT69_08365 [Propionibacteriaceae bacterium]|nr:hypothetical protein [Propionibacteriaceae bacterium]